MMMSAYYQRQELVDSALEQSEADMLGLARRFDEAGVPVEMCVVLEKSHERVAKVLSRAADDCDAACIVTGCSGKSWLQSMVFDSVSSYLAKNAKRPVIVLRATAEAGDAEKRD